MKKIEGIVVPMVTPLTPEQQLDFAGLERLVEYLIAGGCAALFPLGTTGGGPFFSMEKQVALNKAVCSLAGGRIPVITGIAMASPEDTIRLGHAAAEAGSAAVVVAPPCYLNLKDNELIEFYSVITSEVKLPVFVYNMPAMTKIYLKPEVVIRLAEIPGIVGYKDSSNDMNALHEVLLELKNRDDFSIFMGPESLMAETVMLGGVGGVAAGANLYPEIFVNCWKEMRNGNLQEMMYWQEKIDLLQKIYKVYPCFNAVATGVKTGLKLKGICGNTMLSPLTQPDPESEKKIAAIMAEVEKA
ncbi:MAG: dihydrodipicolinate synthase family protein [Lentisphaeria bacterium]|nr:dihydrodipicolinate synthase family protein [Lentisphaeria bacterium]